MCNWISIILHHILMNQNTKQHSFGYVCPQRLLQHRTKKQQLNEVSQVHLQALYPFGQFLEGFVYFVLFISPARSRQLLARTSASRIQKNIVI